MMQLNNTHQKTFMNKKYHVVSLDYTNKCKMLIIKPNTIKTKRQLIEICDKELNGDLIQKFISKMKNKFYGELTMPKFKIQYKWNLEDASNKISYLNTLLNSNIDYSNLSSKMTQNGSRITTMESDSEMINCEYGTIVSTTTQLCCYDDWPNDEITSYLNSPFIFMILDKEDKILNMGIYVGN